MVRAATDGLDDSSSGEAGILGISVLTSLNRDDLEMVGVGRTVEEQVVALLEVARIGGAEGVVCSVHEAPVVKKVHPQLRVFTPGIRAQGSAAQDQKRVATPEEALRSGSDYLVVGRAITDAQDPIAAAISVASVIDIATK
jgi:orotidine-5'-phosphate decarboxylase